MKIHINKLRILSIEFYRNIKNINPPFTEEEYKDFEEKYNIFLRDLKGGR